MTRLTTVAAALSFALAFPVASLAQSTVSTSPTPTASDATTVTTAKPGSDYPIHVNLTEARVTAKVVELDMLHRMATLLTPTNDFVTVRVPVRLHNFDQVKIGDVVMVHYKIGVAARLNPAVKDGIREMVETSSVSTAKPGAVPGVVAKNNVEVLANVLSFDIKARTVTIQGPTRTVTISVPDKVDMKSLQVGDQVQAVFSDAVAIEIELVPSGK